jgi:hypothetical protein
MPHGFLVSPAKEPGPQPITIQNLDAKAHTYTLQPVQTVMSGKWCAPTPTPVAWFHVPSTVRVPAHKTVSVPVSVASKPSTPTDVAVRVEVAKAPGSHVAVSYVSYAQEIVGGLGGSGCAHVRGVAQKHATTAAQPKPVGSGGFPVFDVGVAVLVVAALGALVVRMIRRPKHGGTHSR